MNNKVQLFQFQKIYYLFIVGIISTVILLLSAVPNPSYAQKGKRICMSERPGITAIKINKGRDEKATCRRTVLPKGGGNFGKGRYMTCEAFTKNYFGNRGGDRCLDMETVTHRIVDNNDLLHFNPDWWKVITFTPI